LDLIVGPPYFPCASPEKETTTMSRITTIATWFGIVATFAVVFGGLAHAGHADPEGRVESAHGAVHGIVIPPFQGCRPRAYL
jgi:hypothetical protein